MPLWLEASIWIVGVLALTFAVGNWKDRRDDQLRQAPSNAGIHRAAEGRPVE